MGILNWKGLNDSHNNGTHNNNGTTGGDNEKGFQTESTYNSNSDVVKMKLSQSSNVDKS